MITIKTIPHSEQEYDTAGNWHTRTVGDDENTAPDIFIEVSDLQNPDYEFLIGIHELIEAYLCHKQGITEQEVTEFDETFESNRMEGNTDECGDDPSAPYKEQHFLATSIERILAQALGVDWNTYTQAVNEL